MVSRLLMRNGRDLPRIGQMLDKMTIELAEHLANLGQQVLKEVATLIKPDTIPGWYRKLVTQQLVGWVHAIGSAGRTIGIETFGASASLKELQHKFGFTPASIVAAAKAQLAQRR